MNSGTIISCYTQSNVIAWEGYAGGLVGGNYGSIISSYSTGSVSGDGSIGGLVGYNGGSITWAYSTGLVSGEGTVGGLVGENEGTVISSFWDIDTSDQSESPGGVGFSTAELQDIETFLDAGWDFVDESENGTEDPWWMPVSDTPRLWWELIKKG